MAEDSLNWLHSDQIYVGRRRQGFDVTELLDLPDALRELMLQITRREPVSLAELLEALDRNPVELEVQISQLVAQGWLEVQENELGEWVYRVRIARTQRRILPPGIWQVIDDLWQVPVFRLFPDAVRAGFADHFQLERYEPGAVLFESGDWGERMYIVESGRIELLVHNDAGEPFTLREVSAGGILGEMAVLLGERRPYTARVAQEVQTWTLAHADLDRLLAQHPAVGLSVRRELARRLRLPSRPRDTCRRYNPVITIGESSGLLATHLAEQSAAPGNQSGAPGLSPGAPGRSSGTLVVLIDLIGRPPEIAPHLLTYVDGRSLHGRAMVQTIQQHMDGGARVVVAALPQMTDALMRIMGQAEVVIDMTGGGAPWLRAAAQQYWTMPASTPAQMARMARKLCGRLTGLVLSGGAAHTLAHLGVLDVLHRNGVPVDAIAACGYGALWGVLYAAGRTPEQIIAHVADRARRLRPYEGWPGLRAASRLGLFDARAVRAWIRDLVGERQFTDLEIPCHIAASDLHSGEVVWLQEGSLFNALSASVATPGLVTPVAHGGRLLVDAMLSDPLPADALLGQEMDVILASSVLPMPGMPSLENSLRARSLAAAWLGACAAAAHVRSLQRLDAIDLLIAPDVFDVADTAFDQVSLFVERGRQAAQEGLTRIHALQRGDPS
jgi:NTE family protein